MSDHARSTIRAAVVAWLAAGGTDAAGRVHDSPADPRTAFPALVVEDAGEQQRVLSVARGPGATVQRVMLLDVTAEVQQAAGYAARRDRLVGQAETLLASFVMAGVQNVKPAGYVPESVIGAQQSIAVGRQRFEITYVTTQGAPGTPVA